MNYVDNEEALISTEQALNNHLQKHNPVCIPKDHQTRNPTCLICSMEEMVINKLKDVKNKKARMYSRRRKHLSVCADPNCIIVAHSTVPVELQISTLPQFFGKTCFEIAHSAQCKSLFTEIERKNKVYARTVPTHAVTKELLNHYQKMSSTNVDKVRGRPRKRTIQHVNPDSDFSDTDDDVSARDSLVVTRTRVQNRAKETKEVPTTRRATRSSTKLPTKTTRASKRNQQQKGTKCSKIEYAMV